MPNCSVLNALTIEFMCNSWQGEKARATASEDVQPRDTKTTNTAEIAETISDERQPRRHEDTKNDDQRGSAEHAETVNNDKATTETRIHRQF